MSEIEVREMLRRSVGTGRPPPQVRSAILEGALARVHGRPSRSPLRWRALAFAGVLGGMAALALPLLLAAPAVDVGPVHHRTTASLQRVEVGPHRITLQPHTSAVVTGGAATDIELEAGTATFAVAKLAAGASFRVRTAQALVEVVGTLFDVEADGACTRVAVAEGKVRVTPEGGPALLLVPGDERTFCGGVIAQEPSEAEALVGRALALISGGEHAQARGLLSAAVALHPGGAVEAEALFHLWMLHSQVGSEAEAAAYARALLALEPSGHRADRARSWLEAR